DPPPGAARAGPSGRPIARSRLPHPLHGGARRQARSATRFPDGEPANRPQQADPPECDLRVPSRHRRSNLWRCHKHWLPADLRRDHAHGRGLRPRLRRCPVRQADHRLVRTAAAGGEALCHRTGVAAADDARRGGRQTDPHPLVIVNPAAGGGRARGFWRRCAIACAGMAFEVVETSRRGDAADYAAAAGDRLVVAVGGDGTAHEVVNGLLRRSASSPPRVGFLQRGTGADLRRSIASPRRPEDVAAWLTTDRWRPLDAGRLSTSTGRRYFINVADAGIGAEVVRRAARGPGALGGTVNFLGAAVISLARHQNAPVRLRLDQGPVLQRRVRTIAVANGAYLGGAMRIAPDAQPDDGWFDVVTIGD